METRVSYSVNKIVDRFRQDATNPRELGDRFEELSAHYFRADPIYKTEFDQVWLWDDFPKRGNNPDTGIDLVAELSNGFGYCAIQCKAYEKNLDKKDIDSFLALSSKEMYAQRIIIHTAEHVSKNLLKAIEGQQPPVTLIGPHELENSSIDWYKWNPDHPDRLELKPKKSLRPHQTEALEKVKQGFKQSDRGKLVMACWTGKTFTSLKIAETMTPKKGLVLFLVPSISLLSQTLREWTAEIDPGLKLHSIAVCSDKKVGKRKKTIDDGDITVNDLPLPPTTDPEIIRASYEAYKNKRDITVIFSTYQSIQAIADAQKKGLPEFDLIICDEAHRTTGVTLAGDDESNFVKVHDQKFIQGKKRLYMTATPKIFHDDTKTKALENDAELCSMDDEGIYGPELHRLGFGEAVALDLLTDYKVMVLAVDENFVSRTFQRQVADKNNELDLDDAVKITGCWNGLAKKILMDAEGKAIADDQQPMRRAVAFSSSIKNSERISDLFGEVIDGYKELKPEDENVLDCEIDHVDGKQNSFERNRKIDWLKADTSDRGNVCRILSNVRCLSEGVDVPALDAVMFLSPRNSIVDIVQSVGRVMRKAPGKKYGYIILPVGIPAGVPPEQALKDHDRYKVIWSVLQALRAHDDRFNATINKIELNKSKPSQIGIIGVGGGGPSDDGTGGDQTTDSKPRQLELDFDIEEWRDAIYAKIVVKCGNRRYWEDWAKDVAKIADRHTTRIKDLLANSHSEARAAFNSFLEGLQSNLNPNVNEDEAIEMLSQHLITKPVFDALFEGYEFTKLNPVSQSMQSILDVLEGQAMEKEVASLTKFYESVRQRAAGIDNAAGKQRIILELYDKFFKNAFPKLVERLGIVYTPVEVVDFIVKSADAALKQEFGKGLTDEGVHILEPFVGTGTFITRLLQSGLIAPEDLERKYAQEIHANEILLLAYYIAAINIEETYHELAGGDYVPFNGIVLTDTFQMNEHDDKLGLGIFEDNSDRGKAQKEKDITVIFGNPPYSAGQRSENDNNKNLKYPSLDEQIRLSYAEHSTATLKNSLYGSEIRALKWASERIGDKGIVSYVTNGAFIGDNSKDGIRKCLADEFTSVYCFNLRGNARTSGEQRRKEKGNVFESGTRTTIAILLLIKNPEKVKADQIFYHDIGDYLNRDQKLETIAKLTSITGINWQQITPNDAHDWINQRDPAFDNFIALGDKKGNESKTIFDLYSSGVKTNRDAWCYNFSVDAVRNNMTRMIDFYNGQVESYKNRKDQALKPDKFISNDPKKLAGQDL